jgi:hypothetical protein
MAVQDQAKSPNTKVLGSSSESAAKRQYALEINRSGTAASGAKRPLTSAISEVARNELVSKQLGQTREGGSVRLMRSSRVSISSSNKVKSIGFVNNPVAPGRLSGRS